MVRPSSVSSDSSGSAEVSVEVLPDVVVEASEVVLDDVDAGDVELLVAMEDGANIAAASSAVPNAAETRPRIRADDMVNDDTDMTCASRAR